MLQGCGENRPDFVSIVLLRSFAHPSSHFELEASHGILADLVSFLDTAGGYLCAVAPARLRLRFWTCSVGKLFGGCDLLEEEDAPFV